MFLFNVPPGRRDVGCLPPDFVKYWDQLEVLFSGPFPKPKSCWLATECQQPTELTQHNLVA